MNLRSLYATLLFVPLIFALKTFAPTTDDTGLRGTVRPMEAVQSVMVFATGKDTVKATLINGLFTADVKPGVYQVIIHALPGYQDMQLERIAVEEGRMTDVGELVLQKIIP